MSEWNAFTRRERVLIAMVAALAILFFGLASADWAWVQL